jgi:hypothetical protein
MILFSFATVQKMKVSPMAQNGPKWPIATLALPTGEVRTHYCAIPTATLNRVGPPPARDRTALESTLRTSCSAANS